MDHFTRSTVTGALTRIRRQRLLPRGGEVVVNLGQEVSPLQVLARAPLSMEFQLILAAKHLKVPIDEFENYALVQEGSKVDQGMPLAEKKRLLGKQVVQSPIDGEITRIYNGRIIIKHTADYIELRSMVQGRVVNYIEDRGVTIEVIGTLIQAMWSAGTVAFSPLRVIGDKPDKPLTFDDISGEISNHIIAIGQIDSIEPVQRAIDEGVRGFIIGSMPAELASACRSLNTTILLTDGFGEHGMAIPIFEQLQEANGQETSLFGKDGITIDQRAEIIIPKAGTPTLETPPHDKPLEKGQRVRILRQPYLGQIGEIDYLFRRFHVTPSGVRVRGANVRLPNGQVVFVPTTNLDALI